MNSKKYEKMDKFVDEMNQSVSVVGDMSVYVFNRFREYVGYLFIAVTTVAISFIVAEFIRGFELAPVFGVDTYFIALGTSMIIGLYLAIFGEDAKITTIKGAIFSQGSNRFWQLGASFFVIAVLIMINTKGVQKIADFSLRYLNTELEQSVVFRLKETKMKNHSDIAKVAPNVGIGDSAVKALMNSRRDLEQAKQKEIQAIQAAADNYIQGRDKRAYRTLIARKRVETAQLISKIEEKWSQKIAKIDWKISKAEEKINNRILTANKLRQDEMKKADEATQELITHYKSESGKNSLLINNYKDIGLKVAIAGEIVDGILALFLFMIVKSNPNVQGTPTVQRNTRTLAKMEHTITPSDFQLKLHKQDSKFHLKNEPLTNSLFEMIKKQSIDIANNNNKTLNVNGHSYINHPSQREIITAFKKRGINVTPLHIQEYFAHMGDELLFINQKVGFVFAGKVAMAA